MRNSAAFPLDGRGPVATVLGANPVGRQVVSVGERAVGGNDCLRHLPRQTKQLTDLPPPLTLLPPELLQAYLCLFSSTTRGIECIGGCRCCHYHCTGITLSSLMKLPTSQFTPAFKKAYKRIHDETPKVLIFIMRQHPSRTFSSNKQLERCITSRWIITDVAA